jgi:hypothetical protein
MLKMHIRRKGNVLTMSESIVCPNYGDMQHGIQKFDKIENNKFKCTNCGCEITILTPVVVQDDRGMLQLKVDVETETI